MQLFRNILHAHARHGHGFGTPPEQQERSALLIYFISSFVASCMSVLGKLASRTGVHFFTIVAARSGVLCALVAPLLLARRVNPFEVNEAFGLLLLRGLFGFTSLSLWYMAMSLLPLSDANALSFVSPVLVAVLAPRLLGEATPRAVYLSLPACMVGMLMVAQPTWIFGSAAGTASSLGVVAGIVQALLSTGSRLTIRALGKYNEPLEAILFSTGLISALGAALGSLCLPGQQFTPPQLSIGWAYLGGTCVLALAVQAMFTYSVRKCNAAKAASLDYFSLIWTLLADGLVFHKLPNQLSLAGAGVITAASLAAMLLGARAPAQGGVQAAAVVAEPQLWKREHYLGGEQVLHKGQAGGAAAGGAGSSEGEAVSLIKAAVVNASGWREGSGRAQEGAVPALFGSLTGGPVAAPGGAVCEAKHAAKLALADCATDSSKSWRLGTELEAAVATGGLDSCQPGDSGAAGDACAGHTAPVSASLESGAQTWGLELQAVLAAGPGATRTSTEKEQALAAAGQ